MVKQNIRVLYEGKKFEKFNKNKNERTYLYNMLRRI